MSIILTSRPGSSTAALNEVRSVDPGTRLHRWLARGVGWLELEMDWNALAMRFRERPPVFCRHICPAQVILSLQQDMANLDDLAEASRPFTSSLSSTQTFSVQTRLIGDGWPYARYDVNSRLAQEFIEQGVPLDVRRPEQVLSVVLTPSQGYLGLSYAADNLSDWAGGARRFKREEEQVSRAEFKLLEAMELFRLSLPAGGMALDLGAAPGGWTRILRRHAMSVVAVDPGDLDPRVAADPAVRHRRQTAQSYLRTVHEQFDVILNDMRMDAQDQTACASRLGRSHRMSIGYDRRAAAPPSCWPGRRGFEGMSVSSCLPTPAGPCSEKILAHPGSRSIAQGLAPGPACGRSQKARGLCSRSNTCRSCVF
jgi:23S rRNA (cytidine2498-2'-O)-methyltransferase